MKAADAAIESLDRWERKSGEYFVLQLNDMAAIEEAARLLGLLGFRYSRSRTVWPTESPVADALVIEDQLGIFRVYRENHLSIGDYITFHPDVDKPGGWSVITYRRGDFEARYRKVGPETSPIGEVQGGNERSTS